jgi:hypothetical protein
MTTFPSSRQVARLAPARPVSDAWHLRGELASCASRSAGAQPPEGARVELEAGGTLAARVTVRGREFREHGP